MQGEDDPPGPANDHHICDDNHVYDDEVVDKNGNLSISYEELLSFLNEHRSPDESASHANLCEDSIDYMVSPENCKPEISGPQNESQDAPFFHRGEHEYSQRIPINSLDVLLDEEGSAPECSFDVPGTSGSLTNSFSPAFGSDDFNLAVNHYSFVHKMHDMSSLKLPSPDHGTRDTSADVDPSFSRQIDHEQVSVPFQFVLKDSSDYNELNNPANCTVGSSGRQEAGHDGDISLKMRSESATEMMLPSSLPYMLKHEGSVHEIMSGKELNSFSGGDDSLYREPAQDSPNLGGSFSLSPPLEIGSNCIMSGCSTGDSSNDISSEDTAIHYSSQCLQPQSFLLRSMETPANYTANVRDSELSKSQRLCPENQSNLVVPDRNFGIYPHGAPVNNINPIAHDINFLEDMKFKHQFSIKSSSVLTNGTTSFGDGYVISATKHSGSKQVTSTTWSMDQIEDEWPPSQLNNSIEEVTLLNIRQDPVVDADADADVCILDNVSTLINTPLPSAPESYHDAIPRAGYSDTIYPEESTSWTKAHDERLTFRIALQGLSQPTSEANPPDGVLSVPLLRHQRIALSWMVQKETSSLNCSGGILADDQGLGKTVSTIALILAERSPSTKKCGDDAKIVKVETLNLDDDEEDVELNGISQSLVSDLATREKPRECDSDFSSVKCRPAAGTLVVCPTSVLRQWAEELQNKVTRKGNLSFLIYHGSSRTKDPNELSKYDVVLTTYSIVSMEVPKQLASDKDDKEKGKEAHPSAVSSTKKRKHSKTNSINIRARSITDNALLESTARPLARVVWFRVILDEAQTIKNHRTKVSRACSGLRAKRRWCLSGTPIQNAIDDLYSYFRFLRYDPLAVYTSFCSTIKTPISRNPTVGYQKLQAVLRAIMLRRTKGTCIDGQPIIKLPPKSITLKKIEFSQEERSFYCKLEAESREQFKIYAEAGTVKQNYVNILLMLLRLRQACDHPRLACGFDSNSLWKASLESAKGLPNDKRMHLLNSLEACLAICTICNDPPEDAVVTICGHVFCSQCIREHLTGDDNHCPSPHCEAKIDVVSVYPKDSLKSSVIDISGNGASNESCHELSTEPSTVVDCADSSKIRAAIEILKSLPRLNDSSSIIDSDVNTSYLTHTHDEQNLCSVNGYDGHMTEKAIVFSQWTGMLDLLEFQLKSSSLQYRRFDGTMPIAARDKAIKDFNTLPEVTVMIMSLKAASLGLNMVSACHVLLLDLWWNPTTEDQAIDRAHRIGQTRPVTVSRLTVRDTIEDRILALQEKKRKMVASAFGEDETGGRQTRLTVEDLSYLFMA